MKTSLAFNKNSKLIPIHPVFIKHSIDKFHFVDINDDLNKVGYGDNDPLGRPIHFTNYLKPGKINNYVGLCTPPGHDEMLSKEIRHFKPVSVMVMVITALGNTIGFIDTSAWANQMGFDPDFHDVELNIHQSDFSIIKDEMGGDIDELKDIDVKFSFSIPITLDPGTNTVDIKVKHVRLSDITQGVTLSIVGLNFDAAI